MNVQPVTATIAKSPGSTLKAVAELAAIPVISGTLGGLFAMAAPDPTAREDGGVMSGDDWRSVGTSAVAAAGGSVAFGLAASALAVGFHGTAGLGQFARAAGGISAIAGAITLPAVVVGGIVQGNKH